MRLVISHYDYTKKGFDSFYVISYIKYLFSSFFLDGLFCCLTEIFFGYLVFISGKILEITCNFKLIIPFNSYKKVLKKCYYKKKFCYYL